MASNSSTTTKNNYTLTVEAVENSYNIAANTSNVTINLYLKANGTYFHQYYCTGGITVGGSSVKNYSAYYSLSGAYATMLLATYTGDFTHNNDGTLTLSIAGSIEGPSGGTYRPGSGSVTLSLPLTTIPRASSVSAVSGTIDSQLSIAISRHSSSFTHTLVYSFGSASGTIASQTSSVSVPWVPPLELLRQIPNASYGTGKITCYTYSGGTHIGTSENTLTLYAPGSIKPVVSFGWATIVPYNEGTAAANVKTFVQGYSKAKILFDKSKIDMSGCYGSSISHYRVVTGTQNIDDPFITATLTQSGDISVTCYVYDTRGACETETITIHVNEYAHPTMRDIACYRCDKNGLASETGTYFFARATGVISSLAGLNFMTIRARYRTSTGDFSDYLPMQSKTDHIFGGGYISYKSTYIIEISLVDALGKPAMFTAPIPSEDLFFKGRDEGDGAAFGGHPEEGDLLDVYWGLRVRGDVRFDAPNSLLNMIYPVGSIYMSINATYPTVLFGGVWERIENAFLLAASKAHPAGETGGAATVTLTVEQLPAHNHTMEQVLAWRSGQGGYEPSLMDGGNYKTQNYGTAHTGKNQPHNNMPPYLSVYVWKRTA